MVDARYYQQIGFKLVVQWPFTNNACIFQALHFVVCDCKNVEDPEESITSSSPLGFLDQGCATMILELLTFVNRSKSGAQLLTCY